MRDVIESVAIGYAERFQGGENKRQMTSSVHRLAPLQCHADVLSRFCTDFEAEGAADVRLASAIDLKGNSH
jgi:hypothetical protein